jgi:hypothetical protein
VACAYRRALRLTIPELKATADELIQWWGSGMVMVTTWVTPRLPTLLRYVILSGRESAVGQIRPPSFVAATAELASVADGGKTWGGARRWTHRSGDSCSPTTGRRG